LRRGETHDNLPPGIFDYNEGDDPLVEAFDEAAAEEERRQAEEREREEAERRRLQIEAKDEAQRLQTEEYWFKHGYGRTPIIGAVGFVGTGLLIAVFILSEREGTQKTDYFEAVVMSGLIGFILYHVFNDVRKFGLIVAWNNMQRETDDPYFKERAEKREWWFGHWEWWCKFYAVLTGVVLSSNFLYLAATIEDYTLWKAIIASIAATCMACFVTVPGGLLIGGFILRLWWAQRYGQWIAYPCYSDGKPYD